MISRRGLFGLLPALATLAAPAISESSDPAGPIMYEHVCDAGRSRYTPEEIKWAEENGRTYWGCGTRFRWYFGVPPYCPKCGWLYEMTIKVLESGIYRRIQ